MGRGRITVTPGFLFLMAWCNYADQQGLLLPALAGCALHELGHLAAIWGLGGSVRRLRLTAVGAEIQLERPMSYPGELAAALAGPAANLAAAWLCCRAEGGALFGWGGSFTRLLVALWLLAKEKEGKKGRNRSCQGLQKRVKWFLHSK